MSHLRLVRPPGPRPPRGGGRKRPFHLDLWSPEEEARIRAALKSARWAFGSVARLADALRVSVDTLTAAASGRVPVSGALAIRLARALGKPLESLYRAPTDRRYLPHVRRAEDAMKRRREHPGLAAILAEREHVMRVLRGCGVPAKDAPDLCQLVTILAWRAAQRGRLRWRTTRSLRSWLRVVARRMARDWHERNPRPEELRDEEHPEALAPEALYIARETLALLRRSTTPERFRAIMAYAKGIAASDVARREGVPVATVYDRIRRARADLMAALAREDAAIYIRRRK